MNLTTSNCSLLYVYSCYFFQRLAIAFVLFFCHFVANISVSRCFLVTFYSVFQLLHSFRLFNEPLIIVCIYNHYQVVRSFQIRFFVYNLCQPFFTHSDSSTSNRPNPFLAIITYLFVNIPHTACSSISSSASRCRLFSSSSSCTLLLSAILALISSCLSLPRRCLMSASSR